MAYTLYDLTGSVVQNSSVSAAALSLQGAFLPDISSDLPWTGYWSDFIGVFSGACSSATPQQNCTSSCLNASVMFGGLEIFHNCLLYPAVAALGSLKVTALADSLGIDDQSPSNQTASNITTTIRRCLSEYCGYDRECTAAVPKDDAFYFVNGTYLQLSWPQIFEFDICRFVAPFSFLDSDVGGVGVSIDPVSHIHTSPNTSCLD